MQQFAYEFQQNTKLGAAWQELRTEFERNVPFILNSLETKGILKFCDRSAIDKILFEPLSAVFEDKVPFKWIEDRHCVYCGKFFLSLNKDERLAHVVMTIYNQQVKGGPQMLTAGLVAIVAAMLCVISGRNTQLGVDLAIAFAAIGLALTGIGSSMFEMSDGVGDIIAIELTDLDTVKSAYLKEVKYRGNEISHKRLVDLEKINEKLQSKSVKV